MTVVRNTEYSSNQQPIRNVRVEVEAVAEASRANMTGSVVARSVVYSDTDGGWEVDLFPSNTLVPLPGAYRVTRSYPAALKEPKHVDFIIVPSIGPVEFEAIRATTAGATPITDSELQAHLEGADPHSQYITNAELDAALEDFEPGGEATPDATSSVKGKLRLTNHFGGTADAPEVTAAAFNERSANDLDAPSSTVFMGSQKFSGLAPGDLEEPSDSVSVQNLLDHVSDLNPHSEAGYQRFIAGSEYGPPIAGGPFEPNQQAISTVSKRIFVCVTGGLPGSATWRTDPIVVVSLTAPVNPLVNDLWIRPVPVAS